MPPLTLFLTASEATRQVRRSSEARGERVVGLGVVGGLVATLNSFSSGIPVVPLFIPWLFILLAAICGGAWYRLRMQYGYMLYRVQCQTCQHQWTVEDRG